MFALKKVYKQLKSYTCKVGLVFFPPPTYSKENSECYNFTKQTKKFQFTHNSASNQNPEAMGKHRKKNPNNLESHPDFRQKFNWRSPSSQWQFGRRTTVLSCARHKVTNSLGVPSTRSAGAGCPCLAPLPARASQLKVQAHTCISNYFPANSSPVTQLPV